MVSATANHVREKVRTQDIPKLSAYSGRLMAHSTESTQRLSRIRPKGLSVDNPLVIAMEAPTQYLLAYVHEIARQDIEKARLISELVEVPQVKKLEGETKYVVEKRHLSDIILEEISRIGEEAGNDLERMLIYAKPKSK